MSTSRHKSKSTPPRDFLFEQLRSQIRNAETMFLGIRLYRSSSDPTTLFKTAHKFATHPAYKKFLLHVPFPSSFKDLHKSGFPYLASFERELAWSAGLIYNHSVQISNFIRLRQEADECFLSGNFLNLKRILSQVEKEYGISIWLAGSWINYYQLSGGIRAKNKYLTQISSQDAPWLTAYIINWLSYKASNAANSSEFNRLLNRIVPLESGASHLIHSLNGNYTPVDYRTAGEIISYTDNMSIIDKYEILIIVLQMLSAEQIEINNPEAHFIREILGSLASRIDDGQISRLLVRLGRPGNIGRDLNLLSLIDEYGNDQFASVLQTISAKPTSALCVEEINLLCRCRSLLEAPEAEGELLDSDPYSIKITRDLRSIISFASDAIEARLRTERTALMFCNTSWGSSLSSILLHQVNDERVFAPSFTQTMQALRSAKDQPLLAFSMPTQEATVDYLSALGSAAPNSTALRTMASLAESPSPPLGKIVIAPDRIKRRLEAFKIARQGDYDLAAQILWDEVIPNAPHLISTEAFLLLVRITLSSHSVARSSDLAAQLFVSSRYFGLILPLKELVGEILSTHYQQFSISPTRGLLSVAIVFDIYSRFIGTDRDAERADAYKDVLKRAGVKYASELSASSANFRTDELIYFLQQVCAPDVLDQSLDLQNTREVENERLAILLNLTELITLNGGQPPEALKDELREIRTRQVVRDTTLRLDQSKVYVNVAGIRRTIDVTQQENWNRYQLLMQGEDDSAIRSLEAIVRAAYGEKVTVIEINPVKSEMYSLFSKMIGELCNEFTLNKEFGLNSNLSTNIRHGYVLKELRGPLVARNLITNKQTESGNYLQNVYWNERLPDWHIGRSGELQDILTDFSRHVDDKIEHLNRKLLRIRSDTNPEGLFVYDIGEHAMIQLERRWSKIPTYDEFVDTVFSYFWDATQRNLDRVRENLNTEILNDLNSITSDLQSRLNNAGFDSLIPSLETAITMARPEMRSAVERVSSWFTLPRNTEYQDFDLEIAFEAGLQSVRTYYKNKSISSTYSAPSQIVILGWCLPMFARLFFLLLDNAAEHTAKNRHDLDVRLDVESTADSLLLTLKNDLPADYDLDRLIAKVETINSDYGKEKARDLLGEEGGSGYAKIWKVLKTDLARVHDLRVAIDGRAFVVEIMINSHGVVQ